MEPSLLLYIIVGIVTLEFLLERGLEYLNDRGWSKEVPDSLSDIIDAEKYRTSQVYNQEKGRLGFLSSTLSFVVTLLMLLLGGFAWVDGVAEGITTHTVWQALLFFGIIGFASDLIGIPFELYNTFTIEEKYGFNKMKLPTYLADKLKGWILGGLLGGGLLYAFVWFYEAFPDMFWLYAWGIFMAFSLLMAMFYTNLIVPLFNKLKPLEAGELRTAIESYADSVNFPLKNIMVIDGSKRSTKANAYFSGLGGSKNIVLYDTLIEKHSVPELVAVLAHEVGHYKKKHTMQSIAISSAVMLATLFLLYLFIDTPALSYALGAGEAKLHLGLISFFILYSPLSTITGLLMNVFSRKNEFEADAFAKETYGAGPLVEALKKLSVNHLSNLKPHPAYVFFHYSHPPLLKRIKAMGQG